MGLVCEVLWQWSGLALTAWCMLRALRWASASVRYVVLWASAAAAVVLPLLRRVPAGSAYAGVTDRDAGPFLRFALPSSFDSWTQPVLLFWLVVSSLLLLRLASRVRGMLRVRARCAAAPEAMLLRLQVPIGRKGYAGELLLSDEVAVPSVVGFRRPAIVMSRRLADSISDDELDQVLLHEWAHIVRRDQWARLVQGILESVGFFHPATWWFSRSLDREREMACDEWVTSQTGAPGVYASALAAVAGFLAGARRLGTAPQTGSSRSEITRRIEQLLRLQTAHRVPAGWSRAAAFLLFTAGVSAVHHSTPAFSAADAQPLVLAEAEPALAVALPAVAPTQIQSPPPAAAPQTGTRARAGRRVQAAGEAAAGSRQVAARMTTEDPVRTDLDAVPTPDLDSRPRTMRLDALLSHTAQPVLPPAALNRDRGAAIDVSGFRGLGTAVARGGKGTGGFFQKLAVSARDSF